LSETNELPLYPPRYFRCQNSECAKKWHHTSMVYKIVVVKPAGAGDLFASAPDLTPPKDGCCPACNAPCEPEPGFVYGNHPPPPFEIKTEDNAKWSYVE
jgi:hypothetical protein